MYPDQSDAQAAAEIVAGCPLIPWHGTIWRFHQQKYDARDATGSLLYSGRYHRGRNLFPEAQTWSALYLSLEPETCLGEVLRHLRPERLELLNHYRLTEISVIVSAVLDCRSVARWGFPDESLLGDTSHALTREIGATAIAAGAEGILAPSATRLGDNLVVFPEQLRPDSELTVIGSRDPILYVER